MGNEASIRLGRRRLVVTAMMGSALLAIMLAWLGTLSYLAAVLLLTLYTLLVWLDSSSLTAGTTGSAEPSRRGATLAVHSTLGYAGGFIGPLMIGYALDLAGGMSRAGWGAAFGLVAALSLMSVTLFMVMRPRDLVGDRGHAGGKS
jgi:MFS family permease